MSYQALYRKYRPSSLEDVMGQDVVIQILKNAIKNNKVCHAYMFSGPRGIGKTSIAKLLAKTVNCLNLNNGDACGKCENCVSIANGFNSDIIEIDAASNNGVDEIREIKNKISLVPNNLKYKVYIIDEVHMLSIGAFNALLKTLEEPPEHIIFILATTDLHKVPTTIISRCQCFEFHRISNSDIIKRLKYICENESINVNDEVLEYIAELSEGGLRDAVGMLDKLNAYSNSSITLEDFEKVNGIVSKQQKEMFLNYLINNNVVECIKFIDDIYDKGKDLIIFAQNMLQLCKNKSINYYISNDSTYDINILLKLMDIFNDLVKTIKFSSSVKTVFEISILSFINKNNNNIVENQEKNDIKTEINEEIEKQQENNIPKSVENEVKKDKIISREIISSGYINFDEEKIKKINNQIINNCFARADKKEKNFFESNWSKLNDYVLDGEFGASVCYILDGNIRAVGTGEVIISFDYESMVNRGFKLLEGIQKILEKVYNKHYDVALVTNEEWEKEKNKFISNKSNNISYEYIPLDLENNNEQQTKTLDDSITSQAIELFGEDVISIN